MGLWHTKPSLKFQNQSNKPLKAAFKATGCDSNKAWRWRWKKRPEAVRASFKCAINNHNVKYLFSDNYSHRKVKDQFWLHENGAAVNLWRCSLFTCARHYSHTVSRSGAPFSPWQVSLFIQSRKISELFWKHILRAVNSFLHVLQEYSKDKTQKKIIQYLIR